MANDNRYVGGANWQHGRSKEGLARDGQVLQQLKVLGVMHV